MWSRQTCLGEVVVDVKVPNNTSLRGRVLSHTLPLCEPVLSAFTVKRFRPRTSYQEGKRTNIKSVY